MEKPSRAYLPHLIVLGVFLLISVAYMYPAFTGKVLQQGDVTQWEGSAQEVMEYKKKTGENSLWTNSMFGGMPTYQITGHGGKNFIDFLKQPRLPYPADTVFLLLLGGYILLLTFGVNPWISLVGAIGFCFSSYNFIILEAGHATKAYAIAYVPFVLAGINLIFRYKYLAGAAITTLGMALQIAANHMQITYYMFMMIGLWVLAEMINAILQGKLRGLSMKHVIAEFIASFVDRSFKNVLVATVIIGVCLGIGIATSATNLMLTEEYAQQTIRGGSDLKKNPDGTVKEDQGKADGLDRSYAFQWSQGPGEILTILVPNIYGGSGSENIGTGSAFYKAWGRTGKEAKETVEHFPTYWGALPFTSGPVYYGAIICFLFVVGCIVLKGPIKWWLIIASIFSLLLSLGENFKALSYLFFDVFPFYNKFRSVNMITVIGQICFALMAGLSLHALFFGTLNKVQVKKILIRAAGITGGICALLLILGPAFLDFTSPRDAETFGQLADKVAEDRQSLMQKDAFRSLVFILLAALTIWLFYTQKLKKKEYAIAIIGALILVDLWGIDRRYLNSDNFQARKVHNTRWTKTPADEEILKDTSLSYRVYDLSTGSPFQSARASYWHKSIGGYHAAKLRRFQEVFEYQITRNNMRVLNMLNTKYIIDVDQTTRIPVAQMNPYALGNAWFVKEIALVNDPDTEMDSLKTFEPQDKAIVNAKEFGDYVKGFVPKPDSADQIRLTAYAPNKLNYEYTASSEQLAVFSEVYYDKGWKAFIDGQPAEHIRVDYLLRAMKVPAGSHKIEFRFEPETFKKGESISLTTNLVAYALGIGALVFWFIKRRKKDDPQPAL